MFWLMVWQWIWSPVVLAGFVIDDPEIFVAQVRPILQKYCYECHAGDHAKSGLRLDVKASAFRGGELYGPSIQSGQAEASVLWQFVANPDAELPMPPDGPRLSVDEIEVLRNWIEAGAEWPDGIDNVQLQDPRAHWSLQPVAPPPTPTHRHPNGVNWIDDWIADKLAQQQLEPAPPADKSAWLRRVTLDLTGLPPTPEARTSFLADDSDSAYATVVDRLLGSPEYGPRWGQHWLDVVRYADTHGFEVNTERPNAWPYRDYVIAAFQHDKPYDKFIREQVFGDQMGEDAATGFLLTASVLLPGQIGQDDASKRLARQDALDEIVTNIGQTFLGLSIGCARCHDHRFDPITQRDYFAFQALVAGVEYEERPWRKAIGADHETSLAKLDESLAAIERQLRQLEPLARPAAARSDSEDHSPWRRAVNAQSNVERFAPVTTTRFRMTILATNRLEPCLDELEVYASTGENIARQANVLVTSSGDTVAPGTHELRFVNDGVYGNSSSWMSAQTGGGWVQYEWPDSQVIEAVAWGRDRQGQYDDRLATEYRMEVWDDSLAAISTGTPDAALPSGGWRLIADHTDRRKPADGNSEASVPGPQVIEQPLELLQQRDQLLEQRLAQQKPPQVFGGQFRTPDKTYLLRRGNPEMPQGELPPGMLSVLGDRTLATDSTDVARRAALADWLTDPNHPLVARVMVNRIWQGHFGVGLVATSSDFGRNGEAPTHPELLDALASEFVASGWSVKAMHRLIVLSATYRQSSVAQNPIAAQQDQEARWLWRYPARRLEAETIRDSLLFVAGRLNPTQGGPGFDLFVQRGGLSGFTPLETFSDQGLRRMIFAHKVRRERDIVFGAFDCPDAGQSTATRRSSTTPIQALNLLNSSFVIEQAQAIASRVIKEAGDQPDAQVQRLWHLCFSRPPTAREQAAATTLLNSHGLPALCRAVINSNEFLHLP